MRIELEFYPDDPQRQELCRRYWAWDAQQNRFHGTVNALAFDHRMSESDLLKLVKQGCSAFDLDNSCMSCKRGRRPLSSRSEVITGKKTWLCPDCEADERRARQAEAQIREMRWLDAVTGSLAYAVDEGPLNRALPLSFLDSLYLLSLLRAGANEDLVNIDPLVSFQVPLAPTMDYGIAMVRHLYKRTLISVSTASVRDHVTVNDDGNFTFDPVRVHFALPINEQGPEPASIVRFLERTLAEAPLSEAQQFHRELALEECLAYLMLGAGEHSLPLKAGDKLRLVLRTALERFSIGQVNNFSWRAVRDAAASMVRSRGTMSRPHAANLLPGMIQRQAERALAEGWDVAHYRRNFDCSIIVLSQVFFTVVLGVSDGMDIVPPAPLMFQP